MGDPLATLRKTPDVVRIYGHRGARGVWPENTFLGIKNAFDLGLQVVELDVLVTKDLIPVVTHNAALKADTTRDHGGNWLEKRGPKIYDLTYADLQQYDVGAIRPGSDYAAEFPDQTPTPKQTIPALANIAALLQQPAYADRWLNIEIKGYVSRDDLTPHPR